MSRQRDSVRHATWSKRYETDFERLARDIAFEAGAKLEVRGSEVVVVIGGTAEHLFALPMCPRNFGEHLSGDV